MSDNERHNIGTNCARPVTTSDRRNKYKCYAIGELGETVLGVISKDTYMVKQTQRCNIPSCRRKRGYQDIRESSVVWTFNKYVPRHQET